MSWRDRLPRHDPADHVDACVSVTKAIDTIGAIGNETFLATSHQERVKEARRRDRDSSVAAVSDMPAISAESALRARMSFFGAAASDADSANRAACVYPIDGDGNANSAESANSAGVRDVSWHDDHEERAAIIEHDGKIPREWAEGFARLDVDRPPSDVPLKRWRRFVDDVAGSSTALFVLLLRCSVGDPMTCSAVTATSHLLGLIKPGFCGC
jgi:hypothetical protein